MTTPTPTECAHGSPAWCLEALEVNAHGIPWQPVVAIVALLVIGTVLAVGWELVSIYLSRR